jgi:hypothetical protein
MMYRDSILNRIYDGPYRIVHEKRALYTYVSLLLWKGVVDNFPPQIPLIASWSSSLRYAPLGGRPTNRSIEVGPWPIVCGRACYWSAQDTLGKALLKVEDSQLHNQGRAGLSASKAYTCSVRSEILS